MNLNELRHQMASDANEAKEILTRERETAEKEGRDVSPEVLTQVDTLIAKVERSKGEIETAENKVREVETRSSRIDSIFSDLNSPAIARPAPIQVGTEIERSNPYATKQYRDSFWRYAQDGIVRDMLLSTPSSGGYIAAPYQISDEVVKVAANLNPLSKLFTKKTVNGAVVYRVRKLLSFGNAPSIHAEAPGTNNVNCLTGDDYTYGVQDLTPAMVAKLVKVSMAALAVSTDFESEIRDNFAREFADFGESESQVGNGSGGHGYGVFTANAGGIPTDRDIVTVGTKIDYDDIMAMVFNLRTAYTNSPNLAWSMTRSVGLAVSKIKDSENRPLWQPSLASGIPPTLAGIPVYYSEYAPGAITAGSYVAVLGDWSKYWFAEYPGGFSVQRLNERYAECSEVGFIGRRWFQGGPVDAQAFTRLQIKAS